MWRIPLCPLLALASAAMATSSEDMCEGEETALLQFKPSSSSSRRCKRSLGVRETLAESPSGQSTSEKTTPLPSATVSLSEALTCLAHLPSADPWLEFYGDSLARGQMFDLITLLNRSTAQADEVHPGHYANYSDECTLMQSRPPTNRPKCGGFEYVMPLPRRPTDHRPGLVRAASANSTPADARRLRVSFRLKTFTWEPDYDKPWLEEHAQAAQPDVLLLSYGIWDMQYPPEDDPALGLPNFNRSLHKFVEALSDIGTGSGWPLRFWLTLTGVSDKMLPEWKRPRMSAARAAEYNRLASPIIQSAGAQIIETWSSGVQHPDLSKDGIHFPGPLSKYHSQLFLKALCRSSTARRP